MANTCWEISAPSQDVFTLRKAIAERRDEVISTSDVNAASVAKLNSDAMEQAKEGNLIESVACSYTKLFRKAVNLNIRDERMHIVHSNRAAIFIKLGLCEEAIWDAIQARAFAESALRKRRCSEADRSYIRAVRSLGYGLVGLGYAASANDVLQNGLRLYPESKEIKACLEHAQRTVVERSMDQKRMSTTLLLPREDHTKPVHSVTRDSRHNPAVTEFSVPRNLLTPFRAEGEAELKDLYNFMTVQSDVRVPKRAIKCLEDERSNEAYRSAVFSAVCATNEGQKEAHVLTLGSRFGLLTLFAIEASAYQITTVERWLYLASCSKDVLLANGAPREKVRLLHKRPTDVSLSEDVHIPCNVCVVDMFDAGILRQGVLPAVKHAADNLLTPGFRIIPSSVRVYIQAIELRADVACGYDVSALDEYRWTPMHVSDISHESHNILKLSDRIFVWEFSLYCPPSSFEEKEISLEIQEHGTWNAVLYSYEMDMGFEITREPHNNSALQFLQGERNVRAGLKYNVRCCHNTIQLHFEHSEPELECAIRRDASLPWVHFNMLSDETRNKAYSNAIARAVRDHKLSKEDVRVVDLGAGVGIFSFMAANAGADVVKAVESHSTLANVARVNAARNGFSRQIDVLEKDVHCFATEWSTAERFDVLVTDFFDAGLLGLRCLQLLKLAKSYLLANGASIVPAAATVYCMGIEMQTNELNGFDLSAVNQLRLDKTTYEFHRLDRENFKRMTEPMKVFEFMFIEDDMEKSQSKLLSTNALCEGNLNAVVFWFDLHLDAEESITTAPKSIGKGGIPINKAIASEHSRTVETGGIVHSSEGGKNDDHNQPEELYWGQALQYLEEARRVSEGDVITLIAEREQDSILFRIPQGDGSPVPKAPWAIQWGGGASVENPHFQRVHYTELLMKNFRMKVPSKRFKPIEQDVRLMSAHCGRLFLDPETVAEVYHELVLQENVFSKREFSPFTSCYALSRKPLELA